MKYGITADNYKLDKFREELISKGFTDYEVEASTNEISIIKVEATEDNFNDIQNICKKVELHFRK